jgi:putative PIG3 family NAD(P)H quinone oxidoreductase
MSPPRTMKVMDVPTPGGPDALVAADRPVPTPRPSEVLIEVAAAGLNRADILQRRGFYPAPAGAPTWPGLEVSGVVVAVGHAVREFKTGDAVCALLQGGGYSEYCAVDEGQVLPVPKGIDVAAAASLPEAYFTVWSNVYGYGRLQPSETLLVHGGSSGIGVAAIQLAKARGHVVYTTAGSAEKCRFCEQLGARKPINYRTDDFVQAIARETDSRGVDVVLDMIGGSYVARNVQVLAVEGRLVMIATQGGNQGEVDVLRVMQRRLALMGSTLRARSTEFKRRIRDELRAEVWPSFEAGALRPIVDRIFPFGEASKAHAYMESGEHKGKILLAVR